MSDGTISYSDDDATYRQRKLPIRQVVIIYICVIAFGAATWIDLNGVWVELPLIVHKLPEGWNLPSYMAVIVQLAVIGPLLYCLAYKCWHAALNRTRDWLIISMIAFNAGCTLLLAMFWHITAEIAGKQRSVALFVIFFGLSLVDCTSSVTFLPWMSNLHPRFITAYFVGMGMSGLLPSVLALIQGAGRFSCVSVNKTIVNGANETVVSQVSYPKQVATLFSTQTMFIVFFVSLCGSLGAFLILKYSKAGKDAHVRPESEIDDVRGSEKILSPLIDSTKNKVITKVSLAKNEVDVFVHKANNQQGSSLDEISQNLNLGSNWKYFYLLAINAWICAFMNGVLPSIQSFSCLPYGQTVYHLSACLASIANPIASFSSLFIAATSSLAIFLLTLMATAVSGFLIAMAAMSPDPFLVDYAAGDALMVCSWIVVMAIFAYLRAVIANSLQQQGGVSSSSSNKALFHCGISTQLGSFLGAVTIFPLINVLQLFKSASLC